MHQALRGKWFWYRGGMTVPGCPDWGVRWMIFETLGGVGVITVAIEFVTPQWSLKHGPNSLQRWNSFLI